MGEQYGDSTQLLYLRARYYNPTDGRFINKDPSRLESNLYLYAQGNPVNRVDPTGLFSREIIAKSLNQSSFEGVLSEASVYENWGLIAALLTAEPGDTLSGGRLRIGGFGIPTDVIYQSPVRVDLDGNCNITFNGIPLSPWTILSVVQKFGNGNPYINDGSTIWWRENINRYYKIQNGNTTIVYSDGSDVIDYPDFVGGSIGLSLFKYAGYEFSTFVDRFGNIYITPIAGSTSCLPYVGCRPGSPFEFAWYEGYVGHTKISEFELKNVLSGGSLLCATVNIAILLGISGGGCINSLIGVSTYSSGFQAGIDITWSPFTLIIGKNPKYSWEWAILDRFNGIRREDLLSY